MRLPALPIVSFSAPNSDLRKVPIFHTSDDLDLGNTVGVTENDTDLGGSGALLGELANLVDNLLGGGLEPRRGVAGVGDGGGRNALALAVKTTHCEKCVVVIGCRGEWSLGVVVDFLRSRGTNEGRFRKFYGLSKVWAENCRLVRVMI